MKYSTNSFCLLGLAATAPAAAVLQRVNESKVYTRLGTSPKFSEDVPIFLTTARTEDMIRSSHHTLENTNKRLLEELFWFWDEGADNQTAFKHLTENRQDEAMRMWEQASRNGAASHETITARHNQVILRHALLLKRESADQELKLPHWNEWGQTLRDWMSLIADENLWRYVTHRSQQIDGTVRIEIIDNLRREIFEEVLRVNEELIRFYARVGDLNMVSQHARVISDANLPHIYHKRLLDSLLGPIEAEISATVGKWQKEFNRTEESLSDKQDIENCCMQIYLQLKDRIGEGLSLLTVLDSDNSSDASLAAEEYATLIRSLAIRLSNDAGVCRQTFLDTESGFEFAL